MDNFDIRYRVVYGEKGETEMKFVSWVWLGMTNQAQIGPQIGLLDLKSKNCQRSENENWDELLLFFFFWFLPHGKVFSHKLLLKVPTGSQFIWFFHPTKSTPLCKIKAFLSISKWFLYWLHVKQITRFCRLSRKN